MNLEISFKMNNNALGEPDMDQKKENNKSNGFDKVKWRNPIVMTICYEYITKKIKVAARSGEIPCSTTDAR